MNFENIFIPYKVRKLTQADIPDILELYSGNQEYFKHCPPSPSRETVKEDLFALPPKTKAEAKHFIGLFDDSSLVAVIDLIDGYPDKQTAFIGLLMVAKNRQRSGLGTFIVKKLSDDLKTKGYQHIGLGYIKTNLSAQSFWLKQGFSPTGEESVREGYTVIKAKKILTQ